MDDSFGRGANQAVSMHMGHDVVTDLLFLGGHGLVVDVLHMGLELVNLRLGDGKPQLHLRLGQGHPQLAPKGVAGVVGK